MPRPNNSMKNKKLISFFDRLAALTIEPDSNFSELQNIYLNADYQIKIPTRVFNVMRRHLEQVSEFVK